MRPLSKDLAGLGGWGIPKEWVPPCKNCQLWKEAEKQEDGSYLCVAIGETVMPDSEQCKLYRLMCQYNNDNNLELSRLRSLNNVIVRESRGLRESLSRITQVHPMEQRPTDWAMMAARIQRIAEQALEKHTCTPIDKE